MFRAILLTTFLGFSLYAGSSSARVEQPSAYTKVQNYRGALRFLRADRGYTVTEKDPESGYLLFEYPSEGSSRVTSGSIQVIERGEKVALVVQLPKMPSYHERLMLDALLNKLREDYGPPPEAKSPRSKPEQKEPQTEKAVPEKPPQNER